MSSPLEHLRTAWEEWNKDVPDGQGVIIPVELFDAMQAFFTCETGKQPVPGGRVFGDEYPPPERMPPCETCQGKGYLGNVTRYYCPDCSEGGSK